VTENIVDYYAKDSLSTAFHDLLARLEPGCKDDVAFYLSLLRANSSKILELGCGAGRVSFALSNRGHSVIGIDVAEAMLALARLQRSRLDGAWAKRVNFKLADMTSFSFPRKFDLVIAPYFALNHLPSRAAVIETFTRAAGHLRSGGRFVIHVADIARLARPLSEEATSHAMIQYDRTGNKLRLDILERDFDPSTGHFTQILRYSVIGPDGAIAQMSSERLKYRAIPKEDLDDAAARAGLCREPDIRAGETGFFASFRVGIAP
jgi:SAM-dependent methyltransferase